MKKQVLAVLLSASVAGSMLGMSVSAEEKSFTVGICQLVPPSSTVLSQTVLI